MSKKVYQLKLMDLMDLVQTHYAVGFDASNPSATDSLVSNDAVYKDPKLFVKFAQALSTLISKGSGQYKPFKYSDLRVENLVLHYPVSQGDKKVRFGATLYDLSDATFSFDTTRANSESLVVLDYAKYMGRELSLNEKDDLAFLLNLIRTGRDPLTELSLANKLGDDITAAVTEFRGGGRYGVASGDEATAFVNQMERVAKLIGSQSPIKPMSTQAIAPTTGQVKIAPLLSIVLDYLTQAGFQTGSMTQVSSGDFSVDEDAYEQWHVDIVQEVEPSSVLAQLGNGLAECIYVFQFIANHPGVIEKCVSKGSIEVSVDGKLDPSQAPAIYSARSKHLATSTQDMIGTSFTPEDTIAYRVTPEAGIGPKLFTSMSTNSVTARVLEKSNDKEALTFKSQVEDLANNGSGNGVWGNSVMSTFSITNVGLVPLDKLLSLDPQDPSLEQPGGGFSNFSSSMTRYDHSGGLAAHSQNQVKYEEELLRGAKFSLSTFDNQTGNKNFDGDLMDMTVSTITETNWAANSTYSLAEKSYQEDNTTPYRVSKGWREGFTYLSTVNGKDIGAVNPLTDMLGTEILNNENRAYLKAKSMVQLANEFGSKSKTVDYKIELEVVRGAKQALERVLQRIITSSK